MNHRKQNIRQSNKKSQTILPLELCAYCGDDIDEEDCLFVKDHQIYHESCLRQHSKWSICAVKVFKKVVPWHGHILLLPINVSYLYGLQTEQDKKRKKEKREKKLKVLSNYVSAIRNSGSGHVLIHLVGLSKEENYTGYFDEFADEKLNNLIRDGSSFTDVYRKQRMCDCADLKELKDFTDFLVLYVEGAPYLTTCEFHTKLALDDRIIDPTDQNVFSILKKKREFGDSFHDPQIKSSYGLKSLQESRSIQLKGFFPSQGEDLVTSILEKHRLSEYISAFTKLPTGGSYFYGVHERETIVAGHKSKLLNVQCIPVGDSTCVEAELVDQIQQAVLVCDYEGNEIKKSDLVQVRFIPSCNVTRRQCKAVNTEDSYFNHFVIQVSTKPVSGIVFYDRTGPVAYTLEKDSIKPYTVKEWFRVFMKRSPHV